MELKNISDYTIEDWKKIKDSIIKQKATLENKLKECMDLYGAIAPIMPVLDKQITEVEEKIKELNKKSDEKVGDTAKS